MLPETRQRSLLAAAVFRADAIVVCALLDRAVISISLRCRHSARRACNRSSVEARRSTRPSKSRDVKYAMRLPSNRPSPAEHYRVIDAASGKAPDHKPVESGSRAFLYQAASCKAARRVVAKVEYHFGELFSPSASS